MPTSILLPKFKYQKYNYSFENNINIDLIKDLIKSVRIENDFLIIDYLSCLKPSLEKCEISLNINDLI